jgi:CRP-like cAMP-binding protein
MEIENLSRILRGHPFFAPLAEEHLATIVGCARNVTFEAGEFILREGGPADHFFLLRHGRIALETFVPGRGAVRIETLEPGEVLGWSWLFPPYQAHFDARALTFCRLLSLDGNCLRAKCDQDHSLGYHLTTRFAGVLLQRLEATRMQLLDVYGNVG